ncbi:hypothetical protein COL5a_010188 [Colletotrichum fioriniae]|nr:hypothetical protein COL5a_010188 [Colletotrichum fioriniae]
MRFSTIILSTLTAFAAAAPVADTLEPRQGNGNNNNNNNKNNIDLANLNNLQGFRNLDLNYLLALNNLNLQGLGQLGQVNNLNLAAFQNLFAAQNFDLNALLQLQQLSTVLAIQQQGVFGNVNLAQLNLGGLNLGLIGGVGQVNLGQFIDQGLVGQINQVVQQSSGKFDVTYELRNLWMLIRDSFRSRCCWQISTLRLSLRNGRCNAFTKWATDATFGIWCFNMLFFSLS